MKSLVKSASKDSLHKILEVWNRLAFHDLKYARLLLVHMQDNWL
jgi:hypothetical protein